MFFRKKKNPIVVNDNKHNDQHIHPCSLSTGPYYKIEIRPQTVTIQDNEDSRVRITMMRSTFEELAGFYHKIVETENYVKESRKTIEQYSNLINSKE